MTGRRLTLAFILATPGTSWGGMERHTADLALGLARRGHQVHVLGHKDYQSHFTAPVRFHRQPVHLGRKNPWLQWSISCCLKRIAPDIIHAQGNKAAHLAGRARCVGGTPLFATVHGMKSSHAVFQRMDAVIAVSQPIFDTLDHRQKRLILNGASAPPPDADTDAPTLALPDGCTNVIAVGRLEPVKGFARLIEAWARISPANTDRHLTVIGDGSERPRLEQLIRQHDLRETVTIAGFHSNISTLYEQADLTVISSEREGLPYVLIESLLANCPVVSTPIPGIQALLPEQALSTDQSAESLAELLTRSLGNLKALRTHEAAAMAFARQNLTLDSMITRTEAFYLEVLV
ncbi:glycosyltransferase [Marinobacter salinisoli]|uniref:Glycosyltransferase n=1 Tax=Marinobacter salinisoli TaxID=2769486 RepID=A0ABX7MX55_9GAMM|nr:glycosyltransferase [Marinobacter salinisoli]QSP96062.1 glycosyltransferase [Marinobacter salinisoli]